MTSVFNTSFITSPFEVTSQESKKGYRSSAYNSFSVDVVDFDNESHTFEVEAKSFAEAGERAEEFAAAEGVQLNYMNICKIEF